MVELDSCDGAPLATSESLQDWARERVICHVPPDVSRTGVILQPQDQFDIMELLYLNNVWNMMNGAIFSSEDASVNCWSVHQHSGSSDDLPACFFGTSLHTQHVWIAVNSKF
jgi:hypothetical protein